MWETLITGKWWGREPVMGERTRGLYLEPVLKTEAKAEGQTLDAWLIPQGFVERLMLLQVWQQKERRQGGWWGAHMEQSIPGCCLSLWRWWRRDFSLPVSYGLPHWAGRNTIFMNSTRLPGSWGTSTCPGAQPTCTSSSASTNPALGKSYLFFS